MHGLKFFFATRIFPVDKYIRMRKYTHSSEYHDIRIEATHVAVTADGITEVVCEECAKTRKPGGFVRHFPLPVLLGGCKAQPTYQDRWEEIDLGGVDEILREMEDAEDSAVGNEWAEDALRTDARAALEAQNILAAGGRVFVAKDEDGYYFTADASVCGE